MAITDIPDLRVRAKVRQAGDCWLWIGSLNNNGYGHFVRGGHKGQKKHYAHRYVYATLVGPIPPGHDVHHKCYNRACCNPDHLMAVDHATNKAYDRQLPR